MPVAYLGLGSNIGNREGNLAEALARLREAGIHITRLSSVYESRPVLVTDQPDFLNMAAGITTDLEPHPLLETCLRVESEMGRTRIQRWGPRNIDIDLLLYEDRVIADPDIVVPHPRVAERPFVLIPLLEIAPELHLPDHTPLSALPAARDIDSVRRFAAALGSPERQD